MTLPNRLKPNYGTLSDDDLYGYYRWLARLIRSTLPSELPMRESRRDTLQALSVEILRRSKGKTHFAGHKIRRPE